MSDTDKTVEQLLNLVPSGALFRSMEGEPFAELSVAGRRLLFPIASEDFSSALQLAYFEKHCRAAGAASIKNAVSLLKARAAYGADQAEVTVRVGRCHDANYIDLGNSSDEVVRLTHEDWSIVRECPARLWRPKSMRPLPAPKRGGTIDHLWDFVNVTDRRDRRMIVAWLMGALYPGGPYPILIFRGEQGSAKSTAQRICRRTVDPAVPETLSPAKNELDLLVTARHCRVVSYDNVSGIPAEMSDAYSRLATGTGLGNRKKYTDGDMFAFAVMRPIILNGIPDFAQRQDLLDRAILIEMPRLPDARRRDEESLYAEFEEVLPEILGALCDGLVCMLRNRENVKLPNLPRMADFATRATAAESAFGWSPGTFLNDYETKRQDVAMDSIDKDPLAYVMRDIVYGGEVLDGSATDLFARLKDEVPEEVRQTNGWPQNAKQLGERFNRLAPALDLIGVIVEKMPRSGKNGSRRWRIRLREGFVPRIEDGPAADEADGTDKG